MFRLLTEPSSGVFMSLKLHIFTNIYALVHFVSAILSLSLLLICIVTLYLCWTDRLVQGIHKIMVRLQWESLLKPHHYFVYALYFRRCYYTVRMHGTVSSYSVGVYSYGVCCTWLCVRIKFITAFTSARHLSLS
jgi:hypothetical protein